MEYPIKSWIRFCVSLQAGLLASLVLQTCAYYVDQNPYRHKEILGPKSSFVVEWSVNWRDRSVEFQVSAETQGWIGFGLSKDGRMQYSDAVIGGVDSYSGKPYFNDVHIKGNRSIVVDNREDWKLIGAWEKGKRTYLSLSRAMDTCDDQDLPISEDLIVLIWAYGENDQVQYHSAQRGSFPVYLLDPEISSEKAHNEYRQIGPHSNLYMVSRWSLTNKVRLTARPTSVWCSIKRGPRLLIRHDITGMGAHLPSKLARRHVQRIHLYKCTPPQQTDAGAFFEPYERSEGEECFLNLNKTLPLDFCRTLIFVSGRGTKPFFFPDDIGIPIGESQNEYFLLETHFDNMRGKPGVEIEAGVEITYSHRQKAHAASLLEVGYGSFGTFLVPAKSTMEVTGSCGPQCTSAMFSENGTRIFAAMLYSKSLSRRQQLRHMRPGSGMELPWILKDDNYDSEFQQMRLLPRDVMILPGDQLTTQCSYDATHRNHTSFSGFSSYDEVCSAYIYVAQRMPFFRCTSELPVENTLGKFGIRNFTWDIGWQDRYVTNPSNLAGVWLGDVVDRKHSKLTSSDLRQMQQELKYGTQLQSCPNTNEIMAKAQNKMFRVYTNNWQTPETKSIPSETPFLKSTVSFPKNIKEYRITPICKTTTLSPKVNNQVQPFRPTLTSFKPNLDSLDLSDREQPHEVPRPPSPPPPPIPPTLSKSNLDNGKLLEEIQEYSRPRDTVPFPSSNSQFEPTTSGPPRPIPTRGHRYSTIYGSADPKLNNVPYVNHQTKLAINSAPPKTLPFRPSVPIPMFTLLNTSYVRVAVPMPSNDLKRSPQPYPKPAPPETLSQHFPRQPPPETLSQHFPRQPPTETLSQHFPRQPPPETLSQHFPRQPPPETLSQHIPRQPPTETLSQHFPRQPPPQTLSQHFPRQPPPETLSQHIPRQPPTETLSQHFPRQPPPQTLSQHFHIQPPSEAFHQAFPRETPPEAFHHPSPIHPQPESTPSPSTRALPPQPFQYSSPKIPPPQTLPQLPSKPVPTPFFSNILYEITPPTELKIPIYENKEPAKDQRIKSFFDDIADMFASKEENRIQHENGISFQQIKTMQDRSASKN